MICIRSPAIHCTIPTARIVSCACPDDGKASSSAPSSASRTRQDLASGVRVSRARQRMLDRREEVVVVDGLAEERRGTHAPRLTRVIVVLVARDEDDRAAEPG